MASKRWSSIRPLSESPRQTGVIPKQKTLLHQYTQDNHTETEIGESFQKKRVAFSQKDRENHTHILGSTGTGKSKFMEYLIRQDILDPKAGFCLIDPHGSLYDEIVLYVSHRYPRLAERIVLFHPAGETDQTIGFNPIPSDIEFIDYTLDTLISACLKAWGQDNTDRTPRISKWLENIFYPLIINQLTLVESVPMINIHANTGRQTLLQQVSSDVILDDWQMFESSTQTQRQNLIEGAANRLRKFLRNDIIRQVIGQQHHTLDFAEAMQNGKIVLINLSGGNKISHENSQLLGIMIVNEIFRVAKLRNPRDPDLKPFRLYIDEFAQFVTRDIARALEEARKYKLFLTLAHQHLAQLRSEDEYLYASVMTNCKNKVVFGGLSKEDAEIMTDEISTGFVDLKVVKDERYTTKVRHSEETRQVRGKSHSTTAGNSRTDTVGHSEASGQTKGTSSSQGRSQAHTDGTSNTHGTSASQTNSSTTGSSHGTSQTAGRSHSESHGTQHSQSQGTSHTDQQSNSTGQNTTETQGCSDSDTWSQSQGHSESKNKSQGFSSGKGGSESYSYHKEGVGHSPDSLSFQKNQQQGRNTSTGQTEGSNTSLSQGGTHSHNESSSHGTSNATTEGTSDGFNHSQSEGRNASQTEGSSQSQGTQSSQQSSESQGNSTGTTNTHGSSQSKTYGTQTSTSEQQSSSQTQTDSNSHSTGENSSETVGTTESTVPFLRPEEYQELSSQTFWSQSELHYLEMAAIKNQGIGEAFIKIGSEPPIRTQIDHVASMHYSPRFSPGKIAAFQQRVFAAHPQSYLPVLEARHITAERQITLFGEALKFDEQKPLVLEAERLPSETDVPNTKDPFT